MPFLRSKDGIEFPYRQLYIGDEKLLQDFFESLSNETIENFLPHKFDNETLKIVTKRSEKIDDLVLIALDPTSSFIVVYAFLWHYNQSVPLLGIGIHEDWRRQGLGKQMINVLISLAQKNGCDGIELTTTKENYDAYALYQSCGFIIGSDVKNTAGDGRIVIETSMYYPLTSKRPNAETYHHEPPKELMA